MNLGNIITLDPAISVLFEIGEILGWKFGPIDLKEFDQDFIRRRDHNILPESQIANAFLQHNTSGDQLTNYLFYIVGLNSKMMNTSPTRVLRWLIIEMEPSVTNFNKNVSCTSKFCVKDNLASKEFLVELDALLNIRSKNMNMVNVTSQLGLSVL